MPDFTDLAQRLEDANTSILAMAAKRREEPLDHREADRLEAKAEGVRLALSYVHEAQRFARWTA